MTREKPAHALLEFEVTQVLEEASDLEEAAPDLLKALCSALGWDIGEIWLRDADAELLRRAAVWTAPGIDLSELNELTRGMAVPSDRGLPGRVMESGSPELITDLRLDASFIRKEVAARVGLRSILA